MGIYVQRSCPKCKTILEGFTRDYRTIGPPFVECKACGTVVKLNHIEEWDMKDAVEKVGFILIRIWTNLFFSIFGLFVVLFYYQFVLDIDISSGKRTENFLVIALASYLITFLIVSLISTPFVLKRIRQSRIRTQDSEYIEKINRLGCLDKLTYDLLKHRRIPNGNR